MINAPRPDLDAAIDRVATRLVALPEAAGLLPRVLARLPERASSPWWVAMPVQLAAGAALVLMAFLWARPLDGPAPPVTQSVAWIPEPAPHPAESQVAAPASLIRETRRPAVAFDRPDHERSLAPVEPLPALAFESIAPMALEPEATVVLAPLVLTDLPLASESSPHDR